MENQMIHVKINGIPVEVPAGSTILDAAKIANVEIPTLCYLKKDHYRAAALKPQEKVPFMYKKQSLRASEAGYRLSGR